MSALTEQIRTALYSKLNVSSVTTPATGGVWYGKAKLSSAYPFVVFEKVSNFPHYTFQNTVIAEDSLWAIKVFIDRDASTTKSPTGLGEEILAAAKTAIGNALNISGADDWAVYWTQELPEIKQPISDRNVWMMGFLLRVVAADTEAAVDENYFTVGGQYLTVGGQELGI
jgi:hypothetical protein